MWSSLYTPQDASELVWSTQKQRALISLLEDMHTGAQLPRVVLLHGPTGCGKLTTLEVLLHSRLGNMSTTSAAESPPSSSSGRGVFQATTTAPLSRHVEISVFHTCDASPYAYYQTLRDILSHCSGYAASSSLCTEDNPSCHHRQSVRDTSIRSQEGLSSSTSFPSAMSSLKTEYGVSPDQEPIRAHIIKFYGERATDDMHRYTRVFMQQYEAIQNAALAYELGGGEQQQQQRHLFHAATVPSLSLPMRFLRQNFVFFIHTVHDTHSEKVDLNACFPSPVLASSVLQLFHCTPITSINMKRRLQSIVQVEAERRLSANLKHGAIGKHGSRLPGSPPTGRCGDRTTVVRRMSSGSAASTKATGRTSLWQLLLPVEELEAISQSSQGDIRQALIQTQWATLHRAAELSASHTEGRRGQKHSEASTDLDATVAALTYRIAASTLLRRSFQDDRGLKEEADGVAGGHREHMEHSEAKTPEAAERTKENEAVELFSVSSSSIDSLDMVEGAEIGGRSASASTTKRISHTAPQEGEMKSGSAKVSTARSILDIVDLEEEEDDKEKCDEMPAQVPAPSRGGTSRVLSRGSSVSSAQRRNGRAGGGGDDGGGGEETADDKRTMVATTRDEYLGLPHATARLLTQKYILDDVLDALNVPARKLLDYLGNNLPLYFSIEQIAEYSECAALGSWADALRTSYGSSSSSGGGGGGGYSHHRQVADRTAEDDTVASERQLGLMALRTFDSGYRALHARVSAPRGFSAVRPAPYQRPAYPRMREIRDGSTNSGGATSRKRRRFSDEAGPSWEEAESTSSWSEREWRLSCIARLRTGEGTILLSASLPKGPTSKGIAPSSPVCTAAACLAPIQCEEIDILRECLPDAIAQCGSTEVAVLEYEGFGQYIVLDRCAPSVFVGGAGEVAGASGMRAPQLLPTRTVFTFRSASSATTSSSSLGAALPSGSTRGTGGPLRTTFRFSSAEAVASSTSMAIAHRTASPHKRFCSELRYRILKRGAPRSVGLREEFFALGDIAERVTDCIRDDRPLIPEGEIIEELSD